MSKQVVSLSVVNTRLASLLSALKDRYTERFKPLSHDLHFGTKVSQIQVESGLVALTLVNYCNPDYNVG